MNDSDKAYWSSIEAWLKESALVIEYNENEARHLLRQNEMNLSRVALLRENNDHLQHAIAGKKKEMEQLIKQEQDTSGKFQSAEGF